MKHCQTTSNARTPHRLLRLRLALALILCLIPILGYSAAHYVAKWGVDGPTCRSSAPCLTIQHAIDLSSRNDRIIVEPGVYKQNLVIAVEGLRLESRAGRDATFVERTNPNNLDSLVVVTAARVQIGRKGRGFSFAGATEPDTAGVYIDVASDYPWVKIVGNRFGLPPEHPRYIGTYPEDVSNDTGLSIVDGGGRAEIRNNIFENNIKYGFYCDDCTQALILDNRFQYNGATGAFIRTGQAITVLRNWTGANAAEGFNANRISASRMSDNVAILNGDGGLDAVNSRVESNIVSRNTEYGIAHYASPGPGNTGASARLSGNLAVGNFELGLFVRLTEDGAVTLVQKNTVIDSVSPPNTGDGINVTNDFDITGSITMTGNNAIANDGCGIGTRSEFDFFFSRHFSFGNAALSCARDGAGSAIQSGGPASRPGPLLINRARMVVGG